MAVTKEGDNNSIFTPRQLEIFQMWISGSKISKIAHDLGISTTMVERHIFGIDTSRECRSHIGIYGIIERRTGGRPNKAQATLYFLKNVQQNLDDA